MSTDQDAPQEDEPQMTLETLTDYLVDEIERAQRAHVRAAPGTVQRTLALGETLALFNIADQFGLIDRVRRALARPGGRDAYLEFSNSMKEALLDRGRAPGTPPGNRPDRRSEAPRSDRAGTPRPPRRRRTDFDNR